MITEYKTNLRKFLGGLSLGLFGAAITAKSQEAAVPTEGGAESKETEEKIEVRKPRPDVELTTKDTQGDKSALNGIVIQKRDGSKGGEGAWVMRNKDDAAPLYFVAKKEEMILVISTPLGRDGVVVNKDVGEFYMIGEYYP